MIMVYGDVVLIIYFVVVVVVNCVLDSQKRLFLILSYLILSKEYIHGDDVRFWSKNEHFWG